jgi:hypothetical protein
MEFLVPKFVSFFTCPPCPSYAAMDEVFICKYKIIPCKSVCETTNNQPALLILIRLVLQQMRNAALDDVDCAVQIDPKCCIGQWTPICNFFKNLFTFMILSIRSCGMKSFLLGKKEDYNE